MHIRLVLTHKCFEGRNRHGLRILFAMKCFRLKTSKRGVVGKVGHFHPKDDVVSTLRSGKVQQEAKTLTFPSTS